MLPLYIGAALGFACVFTSIYDSCPEVGGKICIATQSNACRGMALARYFGHGSLSQLFSPGQEQQAQGGPKQRRCKAPIESMSKLFDPYLVLLLMRRRGHASK